MSFNLRESAVAEDFSAFKIEWEETVCPLCAGHDWSPLVEAPDPNVGGGGLWFVVVQCHDCGLCFTNPRPSADSIHQFYPPDYSPHRFDDRKVKTRWWSRCQVLTDRMGFYLRFLPVSGQGRLLDFGCGAGHFLRRMRGLGWKTTGLDLSEAVVERLRVQHGLHVLQGSLPHPAFDDASFDAITMWQSLEHLHHPLEALRSAQRLLAPGGRLVVAVPNIGSLAFRWFGSAWNGLDLPRHLTHFNHETLKAMLHRAGFDEIRVHMARRSGWVRDSAQLAGRRRPEGSGWLGLLKGRTVSSLASWYAFYTRQADCLLALATKN